MTSRKQQQAETVLAILDQHYPDAGCALHYQTPWELLVATILSAKCTDVRVNQVTPKLFRRFPGPEELASASIEELEELIRTTGFFRTEAQNL